jgi:tripartite-type tricarboxylate transporter receptor subunit TctC
MQMKRLFALIVTALALTSLVIEPAAPAQKVSYPEKGRTISVIVPFGAGGSTDVSARMVGTALEKELGVPVQIVNKVGGGSQVGNTAVATAKPDGYTLAYTSIPTIITSYLDLARKAAYTRKSFEPVARTTVNTVVFVVKGDGPYKNMKDLIDAARANPEKVKFAASGIVSVNHLPVLMVEKQAGVKFATVHFDGSAPGLTALLGGHVDAASALEPEIVGHVKAGDLRIIGVADSQESKLFPGVKTMEEQGYKIYMYSAHNVMAPAGTPREVVETLSQAIKKVLSNEDLQKKLEGVGLFVRYLDPAQLGKFWEESEAEIQPLMERVKTK